MNTEKKNHIKNNGAWQAVHEDLSTEVPEPLEKRLQNSLHAFRQDMQEHPYVRGLGRYGFPLRRKLIFFSRRWIRPLLLAGTGLAAAVVLGLLILGNNPPTWAQVQERFRSMPFFAAKIYIRDLKIDGYALNPLAEPKLVEVWAGYGNRLRIRSGSTVNFADKGKILNTFDLITRGETDTDGITYFLVNKFGKSDTICLDSLLMAENPPELEYISNAPSREWMSKGWSTSGFVDTTSRVISDPAVSEDIVVFDHEFLYDNYSYAKARVWALRDTRLPIRVTIWARQYVDRDSRWIRSPKYDIIFTYSKEQPKEFFNPDAFAAKLKDPNNSTESLLFMYYQFPGGDLVTYK